MEKHLIYVTTGTNQYKFNRMLDIVDICLEVIEGEYQLFLQHGSSDERPMKFKVNGSKFISRKQSEESYKNARIIFSHCGIGSIYNSLQYNTPTVIIPRLEKYDEFSDDHQLQIAREVQDNPLIFMVDDELDEDEIVARMREFVKLHQNTPKEEVDLVNYDLANKMKAVFFDE